MDTEDLQEEAQVELQTKDELSETTTPPRRASSAAAAASLLLTLKVKDLDVMKSSWSVSR